jgi:hypothetical protein
MKQQPLRLLWSIDFNDRQQFEIWERCSDWLDLLASLNLRFEKKLARPRNQSRDAEANC